MTRPINQCSVLTVSFLDPCDVHSHESEALPGSSADLALRYPLDVVKTRVQLQQGKGIGDEGYNGMMDCFRKIIKNEGASRLYRGITAPILMEAPKRYVERSSLPGLARVH